MGKVHAVIIRHSPRRYLPALGRSVCPVTVAHVTPAVTGLLVRPRASLAVTPAVVAHRGASGYRPEHTLDAYRLAITMGADDIEVDLVSTADGVLVARHECELSVSTDVASRPEFADRRTTRVVDGERRTGWFSQDLTFAEIKRLTAREPRPDLRPGCAAYDGQSGVSSFNEILAMFQAESTRSGRSVGVMAELKQPSYFASVGLPLDEPLLADLRRHDLDHARSRVTVMSFEPTVLRRLAGRLRVPVVQLLDRVDHRPADLVSLGDPRTYGDLATPDGLAEIDEYADGIAAHTSLVLPGSGPELEPSDLVRDAHRRWLSVHVWTLRAEAGDLAERGRALLDAGVDGLITDHPDQLLAIR